MSNTKTIAIAVTALLVLGTILGAAIVMNNGGNDSPNAVATDSDTGIASGAVLKSENLGNDYLDIKVGDAFAYDEELGWLIISNDGSTKVLGHIDIIEYMNSLFLGQDAQIEDSYFVPSNDGLISDDGSSENIPTEIRITEEGVWYGETKMPSVFLQTFSIILNAKGVGAIDGFLDALDRMGITFEDFLKKVNQNACADDRLRDQECAASFEEYVESVNGLPEFLEEHNIVIVPLGATY